MSDDTPRVIEYQEFQDERGWFDFASDINFNVVAIAQSFSKYSNTLRGLHFQKVNYQAKIIKVLRGEIFDVLVDIRPTSPDYGKFFSYNLSPTGPGLYIPKGFAHGFQTIRDSTEVMYLFDTPYEKENAGGILWNDPDLGIIWPLKNPFLSEQDKKWPQLKDIVYA